MIPDIEVLVVTHLRATLAVTSLTSRIGTRTPSSLQGQFARVTSLDERQTPRSPALHLIDCLVQVDCYGSSNRDSAHAEASLLARTIREAVHAMPSASHSGAVVTAARVSSSRQPDATLEPPRERYVLTCELTVHPS